MQEEDQFPSSWGYLSFISIDPSLYIPACILPISYYGNFIANTIICPALLMGLVGLSLMFDKTKTTLETVQLAPSEVAWRQQQRHTEQRSRYYFAFFLAYPTQAQTFFSHVRNNLTFTTHPYKLMITQLSTSANPV